MESWIEIVISKEGLVAVEVKGAKGKECLTMTEFLEDGLGEIVDRNMKNDIFENREQATLVNDIKNLKI